MSVFPEGLKKVDTENLKSGVRALESYIRYMCERVEFSVGKVARDASSVTDAEGRLLTELTEVKEQSSTTSKEVAERFNALSEYIDALKGYTAEIRDLKERVAALENAVNYHHPNSL